MEPPNGRPKKWSNSATVDAIGNRFESQWQPHHPLDNIDDHLPPDHPARLPLLIDLASRDLDLRLQHGQSARVEEYFRLWPELKQDREAAFELIKTEYEQRRCREEDLAADEYVKRFPDFGGELAARLSGLPVIRGYEVLAELGRGGMGIVYKARQTSLNRLVALKLLRSADVAGAEELARFRGEAKLLAMMRHPNIVQVYDVGEHRGRPFFIQEYVDGGSLSRSLGGVPQPAHQAACLVETLARTIDAVHQRGIIHRDLKPANVLLGVDGTPKITDFGLAKRLDANWDQTRSGAVVGTPSYMAPEQAAGKSKDKKIGPAADVYALGAILYEVLTGRPPFLGVDPVDTLLEVMQDEPVPPRRLQPKIPRDLETICLKCLEKDPVKRYAGACELAEDLRRFQAGEAITARPVSFVERRWRDCKRRPAPAALFTVLVLGMPSLILVLLGWWHEASLSAVTKMANAERLRGAEEIAATEKYHSLVSKVGEDAANRDLGWTWQGLRDLETAADLPVAARDEVKLRGLAVKCLAGVDLKEVGEVAQGINAFCLAYSPDGDRLAIAENHRPFIQGGCRVHVYRVADSKMVKEYRARSQAKFDDTRIRSLAFSPDGRWLAAGTRTGDIHLWDTTNTKIDKPIICHAHHDEVTSVAFKPDGKRLFSCSKDKSLKVWATDDWREVTSRVMDTPCSDVVCDRQGTMLGCGNDTCYQVFEMSSVEAREKSLKIHGLLHGPEPEPCRRLAFSSDGNILAYCRGYDIFLIATYLATDVPHLPLKESLIAPLYSSSHQGDIQHLEFNADDSLVVSSALDRTVKLWEVATGRLLAKLVVGGTGNVFAAFDPSGRHLAVTGEERTLVYEIGGLREQTLVAASATPIRAVAFSPDGQTLACAGYGASFERTNYGQRQELRLWKWWNGRYQASGTQWWPKRSGDQRIASVAFHPKDEEVVHTTDWNEPFRVWRGNKQPTRPSVGKPILYSLGFARDGKTLWGASQNCEVVSLSWPDQTTTTTWANTLIDSNIGNGNRGIHAVCVNSNWVLAGSRDSSTKLLRVKDGMLERYWLGPGGPVLSVALNADETLAASGTQKGIVQIVRVPGGQLVQDLKAHRDEVQTVAFSPDGTLLATGSKDKTVCLWQRAGDTFHELVRLPSPGPVMQVCFTPDSDKLAMVVDNEFAVRLWHLDRIKERLDKMDLGWKTRNLGLERKFHGGG